MYHFSKNENRKDQMTLILMGMFAFDSFGVSDVGVRMKCCITGLVCDLFFFSLC